MEVYNDRQEEDALTEDSGHVLSDGTNILQEIVTNISTQTFLCLAEDIMRIGKDGAI